jgi:hypothetical protein
VTELRTELGYGRDMPTRPRRIGRRAHDADHRQERPQSVTLLVA